MHLFLWDQFKDSDCLVLKSFRNRTQVYGFLPRITRLHYLSTRDNFQTALCNTHVGDYRQSPLCKLSVWAQDGAHTWEFRHVCADPGKCSAQVQPCPSPFCAFSMYLHSPLLVAPLLQHLKQGPIYSIFKTKHKSNDKFSSATSFPGCASPQSSPSETFKK